MLSIFHRERKRTTDNKEPIEGDFGVPTDELRERFAFYTDEFGIVPETKKDIR